MAAKAINMYKLKTPSAAKPLEGFYTNFTGMFLGLPSTKIAQTAPLCEQNGHQDYKWKKSLKRRSEWYEALKTLYYLFTL